MIATANRIDNRPVSSLSRMVEELEVAMNKRAGTLDVRVSYSDHEPGMSLLSGKRSRAGDVVKVAEEMRKCGWTIVRASREECYLQLVPLSR